MTDDDAGGLRRSRGRDGAAAQAAGRSTSSTVDRPAIYDRADGSFIAEMIELAGGEPITTGSTTDFAIPLEKLIDGRSRRSSCSATPPTA